MGGKAERRLTLGPDRRQPVKGEAKMDYYKMLVYCMPSDMVEPIEALTEYLQNIDAGGWIVRDMGMMIKLQERI
jgi:hypothetical protein